MNSRRLPVKSSGKPPYIYTISLLLNMCLVGSVGAQPEQLIQVGINPFYLQDSYKKIHRSTKLKCKADTVVEGNKWRSCSVIAPQALFAGQSITVIELVFREGVLRRIEAKCSAPDIPKLVSELTVKYGQSTSYTDRVGGGLRYFKIYETTYKWRSESANINLVHDYDKLQPEHSPRHATLTFSI